MSVSLAGLDVPIRAIDEASAVFRKVSDEAKKSMGEVEESTRKATYTQKEMAAGLRATVTGFAGAATAAFNLYNAYDRVADQTVMLDRANLMVKSTLNSVEDAQRRYNATVEKYGYASEQAAVATKDLQLAQERYGVATERAAMMQGNLNEIITTSLISIIPTAITMIDSLIRIKQNWAAAQAALNLVMSMNPIYAIVAAIAALVAILIHAYNTYEPFRKAVDDAGRVLSAIFKPAVDMVVGAINTLIGLFRPVTDFFGGIATSVKNFLGITRKETEEKLAAVEKEINKHYDEVIATSEAAYNQQVADLTRFYDEMLKVYDERLKAIRKQRETDLNDLELNFLLQKQATKKAYDEGKMTAEEYENAINELEKNYREERNRISEEYRLKELLAEKEQTEKAKEIETEKTQKLKELEEQHTADLEAINKERNAKIEETTKEGMEQQLAAVKTGTANISDTLSSWGESVKAFFSGLWGGIVSWAQASWNTLVGIFTTPIPAPPPPPAPTPPPVPQVTDYSTLLTQGFYPWQTMQLGGPVFRTGPYLLHAGEYVLPREKAGEITINGPLVYVEGSVDRATAEYAADLVEKKLKNIVLEASSGNAPTWHKRVRFTELM